MNIDRRKKCKITTCPYAPRVEVPYTGNPNAKVVIVGESPGRAEILKGKPFIGPSGEVLNAVLKDIGVSRDEILVTNSCRCLINKEDDPIKDQNLALKNCRAYLVDAIRNAKPKVIITLGAFALQQVMGMKKLLENRGQFFWSDEFKCQVFVTVHPAYIMRGSGPRFWEKPEAQRSMKENLLFMDFRQVQKFLKTGSTTSLKVADTYREATKEDYEALGKCKTIAFDFETNTLNPHAKSAKALCVSFCGEEGKAVVAFAKDNVLPRAARKLLENPNIAKVVANRPFDENVCRSILGFEVLGPVHDVFTMAHLLDENYNKYSLESIADIYTPLKGIKSLAEGQRGNLELLPKEKLMKYSGVDADATLRCYNVMRKMLMQDKQLAKYYVGFIMPIQDMLSAVSQNEGLISARQLRKDQLELERLVERLSAEALAMIPKEIIDAHSKRKVSLRRPALVRDYLFSHRAGLRLKPNKDKKYITKKGEPSTQAKHLRQFVDVPFIDVYLRMKKAEKIVSTYLRKYWKSIRGDQGQIYPSTLLYNTVTGRTVMKEPTIQTVPQRGEFAPYAKRCFVAPKGWLFGARDLGQSEIRIMGWLAKDPNILKALRDGIDIHTMTAAIVNNVSIKEVTKDMRQKAKGVNFGFLYGMSAHSFRLYARDEYGVNFTEAECIEIRARFFSKPDGYWMLPEFHKKQEALALKYGVVRSPLGRLRRLTSAFSTDPKERGNAARQAINMPIQSFSSDLGLIGMMLFWRALKRQNKLHLVRPMWFIHDSVMFQTTRKLMPSAMRLLKKCMEEATVIYIKKHFGVKIGYPITSDGKVGRSWAAMQEWDDEKGRIVKKAA